jgi:hypothetical protein
MSAHYSTWSYTDTDIVQHFSGYNNAQLLVGFV